MKKHYTIEEIRKYILSQDSLGDVLCNLNDTEILYANRKTAREWLTDIESALEIQSPNDIWEDYFSSNGYYSRIEQLEDFHCYFILQNMKYDDDDIRGLISSLKKYIEEYEQDNW